jgi:hypothetical protein
MKPIHFIIFFAIFWSCASEESPVLTNIDGTYAGQFYLAVPNTDFVSSEVTLIFDNGRFTGISSKIKYPAICRGTYEIVGNKIKFANECFWTAEFNWGLMLSGEYTYTKTNGELVSLVREEGENSYIYTLVKSR